VPLELEIDEHDRTDLATVHVLASRGSRSVGTGRFCMAGPGTAQVGRLAVLPEERGTGVGGALLEALVAEAARRGFARVHLYAQVQATGFYRKAGFYDDGPPLWDAGILHQPMSKALGG